MTAAVNGTVWLWSADGSPETYFLADDASPDRIFDVAFDPQGEYILIGVRRHAGLWTWEGDLLLELRSSGYKVQKVRFTPDGSHIVTIADNPSGGAAAMVDLWSRAGRHVVSPHGPNAVGTFFDPHSRYFCLQSSADVRIFDVNGQLLGAIAAATGIHLRDLAISTDGDFVAPLFSDLKVRLWEFNRRRRAGAVEIARIGNIAHVVQTANSLQLEKRLRDCGSNPRVLRSGTTFFRCELSGFSACVCLRSRSTPGASSPRYQNARHETSIRATHLAAAVGPLRHPKHQLCITGYPALKFLNGVCRLPMKRPTSAVEAGTMECSQWSTCPRGRADLPLYLRSVAVRRTGEPTVDLFAHTRCNLQGF
jgi:WD40 repeat protein